MNINWYGQTCFRISAQKEKNGAVNILIDPFDNKETGLRSPKLEADILLLATGKKATSSPAFLIDGPGEYEVKGVYIQGIPANNRTGPIGNTIYTIEVEELKICHLGFLNQKELTSEQLEDIGDVDILMIPIGGGEAIGAVEAVKIMSQIEPKITIPMYYRIPGLKIKLEELSKFLKVLGLKSLESLPKLSVKKKDLSEEEARIVVLKP